MVVGVGGGRGEGRGQGRTYLPLESFKDQTQCYVCVVLPTSINIHREGICCFPEEIQASPLARPHGAALPSPPSALSAAAPASEVPPCSSERTAAVPWFPSACCPCPSESAWAPSLVFLSSGSPVKLHSDVAGFLVGTMGTERTGGEEMSPSPGRVSVNKLSFPLSRIFSGQWFFSSISPVGVIFEPQWSNFSRIFRIVFQSLGTKCIPWWWEQIHKERYEVQLNMEAQSSREVKHGKNSSNSPSKQNKM